ncbi:MAG: polymer-forming cytoskeletal protein [Spirochaetaceae bacterium]|nr:polymer-forming cytoskeletal protein [Spirochaetaceae bacterium]
MPELKDSLVNSLIGAGSAVAGDLDVEGMLRVDGDLRGSIRATGKVVVGAGGRVEASIRARSAIIGGLVKGDVYVTEQLRILSGGVVVGSVFAPRLEAEEDTLVHGELAVTGRPDRAEEELKAFVERRGGARFLGRFRAGDFVAQAAQAAQAGPSAAPPENRAGEGGGA